LDAHFLKAISSRNLPYKPEAYLFVLQGMSYAQTHRDHPGHLGGQEFARHLAEFGRKAYIFLFKEVLSEWGVRETMDFGRIVYGLIEMGQMSKLPEDSIEDFRKVYDFEEEFGEGYDWPSLLLEDILGKQETG